MKKRKIDQTKIVIKPAKTSGAKNRVSVLKLYCETSVSCNFVGVVSDILSKYKVHP